MKPVSLPLCQKMPKNSGTRTQQAMIPMLTATRGTICCGTLIAETAAMISIATPIMRVSRRTFRSAIPGFR